jgi:hypothetical protein
MARKIYAEKVALTAMNAGEDGPPEEGQHCSLVYGSFSVDEMATIHGRMNETLIQAGRMLISQMVEEKGPEALLSHLLGKLNESLEEALEKHPDILSEMLKAK